MENNTLHYIENVYNRIGELSQTTMITCNIEQDIMSTCTDRNVLKHPEFEAKDKEFTVDDLIVNGKVQIPVVTSYGKTTRVLSKNTRVEFKDFEMHNPLTTFETASIPIYNNAIDPYCNFNNCSFTYATDDIIGSDAEIGKFTNGTVSVVMQLIHVIDKNHKRKPRLIMEINESTFGVYSTYEWLNLADIEIESVFKISRSIDKPEDIETALIAFTKDLINKCPADRVIISIPDNEYKCTAIKYQRFGDKNSYNDCYENDWVTVDRQGIKEIERILPESKEDIAHILATILLTQSEDDK